MCDVLENNCEEGTKQQNVKAEERMKRMKNMKEHSTTNYNSIIKQNFMYLCMSPAISHVFITIDMRTMPQRTRKEKQSGPCLHFGFGEIGKDETYTNQQKTVHAHHIVVMETKNVVTEMDG